MNLLEILLKVTQAILRRTQSGLAVQAILELPGVRLMVTLLRVLAWLVFLGCIGVWLYWLLVLAPSPSARTVVGLGGLVGLPVIGSSIFAVYYILVGVVVLVASYLHPPTLPSEPVPPVLPPDVR
jgi:hypothetical protein